MRIVRVETGAGPRLGVVFGDEIREVPDPLGSLPVEHLLAGNDGGLGQLEAAARQGAPRPAADAPLLPALGAPGKIVCVGQNYVDHAQETHTEPPMEPVFFSKLSSSLAGAGDPVILPRAAPRRVDYEAELAVVIGRAGRDIAAADAMSFVAAYTVANDISARDWQLKKPSGQWLLGKSFDSFLPLGPALVTADEIEDPGALRVICRLDGETVQDDVAEHMIFPIPTLISYLSQVATLQPGDLLLTGTPAGVGMARTPPRWLQEGDLLETEIPGVGLLQNPVRAA